MSCGCLAGRPYSRDTRESQLSPSYLDSSHSSIYKSHGSLRGMLSCELLAKTLQSSIAWVFTLSLSITQPLQSNLTINTGYKRLNKIIIKFGTEWKPTKHIVVNYNFTMVYAFYFMFCKIKKFNLFYLYFPHMRLCVCWVFQEFIG